MQTGKRPKKDELPADLKYVSDSTPGIARKRSGKGFYYVSADGSRVKEKETLQRIRSLAIPPAWTSVWICSLKNGHLQAVGRDARGRKQYRYHPAYRAIRNATKFSRMAKFAAALPAIRERVEHDLNVSELTKEKILATVVRLLERTAIRVGNEEYARTNKSYGLTTMQDRHVDISGYKLRFHFRGKSGLLHDIELTDRKLARILSECQDIPGRELFHYVDESGEICRISSGDVNDYLREITAQDFTAKDFRTWVGSGQTALELEQIGPATSQTEFKKNVVTAIKNAAAKLGNKPSTCRNYYVHPAVLEGYQEGTLFEYLKKSPREPAPFGLRAEETCVLQLVVKYDPSRAVQGKAA
jgi:DNA topoisomerase-1